MATQYTPAQAALLTGLAPSAIRKALESRIVPARKQRHGQATRRLLGFDALVCLKLEQLGMSQFSVPLRKEIYQQVIEHPESDTLRPFEAVSVDVARARSELSRTISDLRKAEKMVVVNPDVLRGVPIFRGTRIPVYSIAEMLEQGTRPSEILEGYPRLSSSQLRLATLYAQANPRRGRPKTKLPIGARLLNTRRIRLDIA